VTVPLHGAEATRPHTGRRRPAPTKDRSLANFLIVHNKGDDVLPFYLPRRKLTTPRVVVVISVTRLAMVMGTEATVSIVRVVPR
jgi:hypothetical protein